MQRKIWLRCTITYTFFFLFFFVIPLCIHGRDKHLTGWLWVCFALLCRRFNEIQSFPAQLKSQLLGSLEFCRLHLQRSPTPVIYMLKTFSGFFESFFAALFFHSEPGGWTLDRRHQNFLTPSEQDLHFVYNDPFLSYFRVTQPKEVFLPFSQYQHAIGR